MRRSRFAHSSHGFLGQDGRNPGAIADEARDQLLAYPTVQWLTQSAVSAAQLEREGVVAVEGDRANVTLASGRVVELAAHHSLIFR
ncbi:hypothetical protein ACIPZ8_15650 [Pseudomonas sp. NPDC089422]|uniref:hypothetical protein n=1 Tax=Pseudomonas sp. NPDC089422 TaxID=3364466 RepID=UPI0038175EB1